MLVYRYMPTERTPTPTPKVVRRSMIEASRLIASQALHQTLLDPIQSAMIHDHLVAIHSTGRRSRVLDLGSGSGVWALALANSEPYCDVLAIETDWSSLTPEHTSLHGNIDFDTVADLDNLPNHLVPLTSFDLIHIKGALLRTRSYPALVQRMAQLLRPHGKLVLVENEVEYVGLLSIGKVFGMRLMDGKHSANGSIPKCLRTWHAATKEAYASVGVDVEMATRLVPCLEASGMFEPRVWIQELGVPCGRYMESNSPVLAQAGDVHASLLASTLAKMQPILERYGYERKELNGLRDGCVAHLCDPNARFFQRLFSVCGTRAI